MVAQQKAPGLEKSAVKWLGDYVQCGNQTIYLPRFHMFLQDRVQHMWSKINQEVLCSVDLGALGIKIDLSPRRVDCTTGGGAFSGGWDILTESNDSIKLQKAIACTENSFLTSPINISKAEAWLKSIHMVWQELFCLIHVLGGPFPSFFLEELELLYSTSPTRRGDFFLVGGSLATVNSYEGERHSMLGEYKKRLRLLPHPLSTALVIMLRLIRPLELSILLSTPGTPQNKENLLWNYRHILYVTHGSKWSTGTLSNIWHDWIMRGVGFRMDARQYRTFCKSWEAKYGSTNKVGWLGKMADAQAGHSSSVSKKHYGRLDGIGGLDTTAALFNKEQCMIWHKWLGF